jgi:DnaJ-domain-containing protein 1
MFLPFDRSDGTFTTIAKTAIRMVTPLTREKGAYEGSDPYRVLGVPENAGLEDVKQAYRRLCAENHPDRLKGLGLTQEYLELANVRMARINEAYQKLMKRHAEPAE